MIIPKHGPLEPLSKDDLESIHYATLELLETLGVKVNDEDTLRLLHDNGCEVDFKTMVVKFPQYLVEECVRLAPKTIAFAGRNTKYDLRLQGRKVHFGTGSGTLWVHDIRTGGFRRSGKRDVEDAAKLSDALPEIDYVMSMFCSQDVAYPSAMTVHDLDAMLRNTEKPIQVYDYGVHTNHLIDMATAVVGSMEELRKRPIVLLYSQPVSPLTHDGKHVQSMRMFAKERLPMVYVPAPKGGTTGPMSLAGWIVQCCAESLSANVFVQLTRRGTPFIFGIGDPRIDLKTLSISHAAPEFMLTNLALTQLGAYYGLPTWTTGGITDATTMEAQATAEAVITLYNCALSGANLVHDVGFMGGSSIGSLELLTICDEFISFIRTVVSGIRVNKDTLALDVIRKVGIGGHFMLEEHTRRHLKDEYWETKLLSRLTVPTWQRKGGKDLIQRAREKTLSLLEKHEVPPLPKHVQNELQNIIKKAEKESSR